jgi:hypothetical protein
MKAENFERVKELISKIDRLQDQLDSITRPGCQVKITRNDYSINSIEYHMYTSQMEFFIKSVAFDIEERIAKLKAELEQL